MICHTGNAGSGSRQPIRHSVGNGTLYAPNVPLSCEDLRKTRVKVCTQPNSSIARNVGIGTMHDAWMNCGRVSANKASIEGRANRAEQKAKALLVLHADGQGNSICLSPIFGDYSGGYFGRGKNLRTNWRANARPDGARVEGKATQITRPLAGRLSVSAVRLSILGPRASLATAQRLITNSVGVDRGPCGKVQLCALAARVHDKLSVFLGYHADTRPGRSAGARSGASAFARANLQSKRGGRSAPHSQDAQEARTALLAFGTIAAAYVWAACALWVL